MVFSPSLGLKYNDNYEGYEQICVSIKKTFISAEHLRRHFFQLYFFSAFSFLLSAFSPLLSCCCLLSCQNETEK